MREVGAEIRRLRQARGWTGAQLAVYAGMAPSAISQIETGRRSPNAGSLEKIAAALEVAVVDLFPKAQSPLPEFLTGWEPDPEPISAAERIQIYRDFMNTGLGHAAGEKPQAYFVEGAIGIAANGWLDEVTSPDTPSDTAWGIVRAARALEDALSILLGAKEPHSLSGEVLGQIARTMKLLEDVEARYGVRLEEEMKQAPPDELAGLRQRKEELRELQSKKSATA